MKRILSIALKPPFLWRRKVPCNWHAYSLLYHVDSIRTYILSEGLCKYPMYKIIIASYGRHKKANGFLSTISCLSKTKNIKKQGGIKRIPTNKQWNFLRGVGRMLKICMNYTRIGNTFNTAPPILARQQKIIQTNRYN